MSYWSLLYSHKIIVKVFWSVCIHWECKSQTLFTWDLDKNAILFPHTFLNVDIPDLPDLAEIYWALPDLTGPYRTSTDLTRSHQTLPDLTRPYRTSLDLTGPHWISPDLTWPYRTLPSLTGSHQTLPDLQYLTWPDHIRIHKILEILPGLKQNMWDSSYDHFILLGLISGNKENWMQSWVEFKIGM